MHPLAYGITGENPDYGDCLQPADAQLLTGGSSSGAAASIQEGSALLAIGTDTGGSIRVPAALCGLAGFRASHTMTEQWPEMWRGGVHLAPSFDTLGFLAQQASDLQRFAHAFFSLKETTCSGKVNIGYAPNIFLQGCDQDSLSAFECWKLHFKTLDHEVMACDSTGWEESFRIFAPIQAHEAAQIHAGNFAHFEPSIQERLTWGATLSSETIAGYRERHSSFRSQMDKQFDLFDFLLLPASPVTRLTAGTDLSGARPHILTLTTPFSLGGNPVVTLPGSLIGMMKGTGVQLIGRRGQDASLLAFAAELEKDLLAAKRTLTES